MKAFVMKTHSILGAISRRLGWLPPLVARISVGAVFAETGWGKLNNLSNFTAYLVKLGIPMPSVQAPFVATVECVCGTLLVLGILTRLVSVPLIVIMVVAIWTAKRGDINTVTDLFEVFEYLYAVMLAWIVINGPGPVSVDRLTGIEA